MDVKYRFDPELHRYWMTVNGIERPVPSVTQVLGDLLPGWRASEFYLGRGRAVHACAALVAKGIHFEHDPRIAGQVEAVRRFLQEAKPDILDIEQQVYSERFFYGGTLDFTAMIPYKGFFRPCVFDYKASVRPSTIYQCAAYALAYQRHQIDLGCGVELHDDGTYTMTEIWPLDRAKREWLHLLGAYNIRTRLGLTSKEDEHE